MSAVARLPVRHCGPLSYATCSETPIDAALRVRAQPSHRSSEDFLVTPSALRGKKCFCVECCPHCLGSLAGIIYTSKGLHLGYFEAIYLNLCNKLNICAFVFEPLLISTLSFTPQKCLDCKTDSPIDFIEK